MRVGAPVCSTASPATHAPTYTMAAAITARREWVELGPIGSAPRGARPDAVKLECVETACG